MARAVAQVALRSYRDEDETSVLGLLDAALGGGPAGSRPAEFFRWKHMENPFGRSYLLVAEAEDRIVGLRAFMRWGFVAGDRTLRAVRAVDTATHPEFQGRGIFSSLTHRALDDLGHETDLIFNTPNEKSLPGYLKMGWKIVGRVPIHVRIRRPVRFLLHARTWKRETGVETHAGLDAMPAGPALSDPRVQELLDAAESFDGISTARTAAYLRWRYGEAPLLDYRVAHEERAGALRSLAIFRVRPRGALVEATISELITRTDDVRAARRTLSDVARVSSADHVTCSFPMRSTAMSAARRAAFVRVPGGLTLVANTLGHDLRPDPLALSAWALSAGDLEVF